MKSRRLITGTLLSLCMTGAVLASTTRTSLGALPDGDFGIVGDAAVFSQSFQETVRVSNDRGSLSKALGSLKGDAVALGRHAFVDLTPGSQAAAAFGPANNPGVYTAAYRASVAAVPEIQTWLMLLIGLGLAAYQLHRKQKALGQQVLNDDAMSSA